MPTERLAYQAVKYQQRDGWSHPRTDDAQRNAIYHWITKGWPSVGAEPHPDAVLRKLWAWQNNVEADAFIIYTDSGMWHGKVHPTEALQEYRRRTGIPAKLIVVGMVSNGFSIADPNDGGMLDIVGFDTAAPQLMADFIAA